MQRKAGHWSTFWQVAQQPPQQQAWWPNFRAAGRRRSCALEPITSHEVAGVLEVFKPVVGIGADRTNPRCWGQLAQEGIPRPTYLLKIVEQSLAWPAQMLVNVVQLMHKSKEPGRPITLTQATYR
eukprot:6618626-Pyramimonas_sp.AAC.1